MYEACTRFKKEKTKYSHNNNITWLVGALLHIHHQPIQGLHQVHSETHAREGRREKE